MKKTISENELWPFYKIDEESVDGTGIEIEMTEDEINKLKSYEDAQEFMDMLQSRVNERFSQRVKSGS